MLPDRVAAVIVRNKKVLLVTGPGPDFFWTPGGKVGSVESHEVALARELKEELQVSLKSVKQYLTYKTFNEATGKHQMVHCYLTDFEGNLLPTKEIEEYQWISKEDLAERKVKLSKGIEKNLIPQLIGDKII